MQLSRWTVSPDEGPPLPERGINTVAETEYFIVAEGGYKYETVKCFCYYLYY